MATHILAYVQTGIISRWKRLTLKHARDRQPVFVYGSDDDRQFAAYARNGAVLCIVASHRRHPPALVARLAGVQRIDEYHARGVPRVLLRDLKHPGRDRPYRHRVKGGRGSRFFGHNDASQVLRALTLLGSHGNVVKRAGAPWIPGRHGRMLLRPHRVQDAASLSAFAASLQRRAVFVSWKHADTKGRARAHYDRRRRVREFVDRLTRRGVAVWLDERALPDYHPRTADDRLLELLLAQGLTQSRLVIAVATPHYGSRSEGSGENWTLREWRSKAKRSRAVFFADATRGPRGAPGDGPPIDTASIGLRLSGDPSVAARQVARRLAEEAGERS